MTAASASFILPERNRCRTGASSGMSSSARAGTYLPLLSRAREVTPFGGFQSDAAVPETVMDAEVVVLGMMSAASVGAVEPLDASVLVGVGEREDMMVVVVIESDKMRGRKEGKGGGVVGKGLSRGKLLVTKCHTDG